MSELVSLCLGSVFPDPYNLKLTFEMKRNQSEALIQFQKDDSDTLINPEMACGGGPVDVAAFGFRISLMTLQKKKARPVLMSSSMAMTPRRPRVASIRLKGVVRTVRVRSADTMGVSRSPAISGGTNRTTVYFRWPDPII